ncbi:MAG: LysR family transcriptional regulator, partial [Thiohalomonadales bacterium]
MDLNAMYLFVYVVDYKSFSVASVKTGVPTSSISRKISELEANLNVKLLERTTRQLRLTEKGRIFYENIQPAVNTLYLARQNLVDNDAQDRGTLRITIPPGIEKSVFIPLFEKFKKSFPDIRLKVLITGSELKFIEDGIDIALRIGELENNNLIAITLLEYEHVLVASPGYLNKHGTPVEPIQLNEHHLICGTNWHDTKQWKFVKNQQKFVLDINESLSLNHYAAIQLAIEKDMGIGELPSINCAKEIQQGKLIRVLPDWQFNAYNLAKTKKLKLSIVYTANRYNSALIQIFKNFCVDYFK